MPFLGMQTRGERKFAAEQAELNRQHEADLAAQERASREASEAAERRTRETIALQETEREKAQLKYRKDIKEQETRIQESKERQIQNENDAKVMVAQIEANKQAEKNASDERIAELTKDKDVNTARYKAESIKAEAEAKIAKSDAEVKKAQAEADVKKVQLQADADIKIAVSNNEVKKLEAQEETARARIKSEENIKIESIHAMESMFNNYLQFITDNNKDAIKSLLEAQKEEKEKLGIKLNQANQRYNNLLDDMKEAKGARLHSLQQDLWEIQKEINNINKDSSDCDVETKRKIQEINYRTKQALEENKEMKKLNIGNGINFDVRLLEDF